MVFLHAEIIDIILHKCFVLCHREIDSVSLGGWRMEMDVSVARSQRLKIARNCHLATMMDVFVNWMMMAAANTFAFRCSRANHLCYFFSRASCKLSTDSL